MISFSVAYRDWCATTSTWVSTVVRVTLWSIGAWDAGGGTEVIHDVFSLDDFSGLFSSLLGLVLVLELSVFFLWNGDLSTDVIRILFDWGLLLLALSGTAGLGDLGLVSGALLVWDNHVLGTDGGGGSSSGGSEGTDTSTSLEVSGLTLEAGWLGIALIAVIVLEVNEFLGLAWAASADCGNKCSNYKCWRSHVSVLL